MKMAITPKERVWQAGNKLRHGSPWPFFKNISCHARSTNVFVLMSPKGRKRVAVLVLEHSVKLMIVALRSRRTSVS